MLNSTHDITYIEWDPLYVFDNITWREYYDIKADPWQQTNKWATAQLKAHAACHGTRDTPSDCP